MTTPTDPTMIDRAFEIADESQYSLLETTCVPIDASPTDATAFGFVDTACCEVKKLAEACPTVRDAFDWLCAREYVALASDAGGEFVQVLRRPGEDA